MVLMRSVHVFVHIFLIYLNSADTQIKTEPCNLKCLETRKEGLIEDHNKPVTK